MTPFILEKTSDSPGITLDKKSGTFLFEGTLIPENASDFFQPIHKWVDEYLANPNQETKIVFKMDYFNTSSSKSLLDLLSNFKKLTKNNDLIINWYYNEEDQEMLGAGEGYSEIINLKFNYLKRKS